jgi:lipopolysaccharide transport system ATP-binding protein
MSDIAIRVDHLSKRYKIGGQQNSYKTLRESLMATAGAPLRWLRGERHRADNIIWALDDVSFEVKQGEAIGIIGRNGAGKSTLLKILSRITKPTRGRIEMFGRVGSLLEVGTGFHPELTGRDNIYLNGAILGMRREEIKRKFDEIVEFAEIDKFLDTAVKYYSSGMYVRLAFAVAAQLEPEILIVDEVLAVGDADFQKKCLGKMGDVAQGGRTVLFVSHNMGAIQSLCSRAYLISQGKLIFNGESDIVINKYLEDIKAIAHQDLTKRIDRTGNQKLKFTHLDLEDQYGNKIQELVSGKDHSIVLSYESDSQVKNVSISIGFSGNYGQFLLLCNNEMAGQLFEALPSKGQIKCKLPHLPFSQGIYNLNLYCKVNGILADWVQEAAAVTVVEGDFYGTGKGSPATHGGFLATQIWSHYSEK